MWKSRSRSRVSPFWRPGPFLVHVCVHHTQCFILGTGATAEKVRQVCRCHMVVVGVLVVLRRLRRDGPTSQLSCTNLASSEGRGLFHRCTFPTSCPSGVLSVLHTVHLGILLSSVHVGILFLGSPSAPGLTAP